MITRDDARAVRLAWAEGEIEVEQQQQPALGLAWEGWRTEPRNRHGEWTRLSGQALLGGLLSRARDDGAGKSSNGASDKEMQASVLGLTQKTSDGVPGMFGRNEHLDFDGKPPRLFDPAADPGLLADIDWNGHMSMSTDVASGIQDGLRHTDQPIAVPGAFTVPLHEMIHATVPAGQKRSTNGDKQAYQDYAQAQIEEGFTELGAIQHAKEFFTTAGIGDRKVLDKGSLEQQQHLADINGEPFVPDLSAHRTMSAMADELNDPARIRQGRAWHRYPAQTAQAFEWASMIAQMRTGKGEDDPATRREIQRVADEVNAVGTAAKLYVMARHVNGDMSPDEEKTVMPVVEASIRDNWKQGAGAQVTFATARTVAAQRLQALRQSERAAA